MIKPQFAVAVGAAVSVGMLGNASALSKRSVMSTDVSDNPRQRIRALGASDRVSDCKSDRTCAKLADALGVSPEHT